MDRQIKVLEGRESLLMLMLTKYNNEHNQQQKLYLELVKTEQERKLLQLKNAKN